MFYTGSVPEAIQTSKRQQKPLIIFLKGNDEGSEAMEEVFRSSELGQIVEQSIVLRLEDDLSDSSDSKFMNGRMFRQLYPIDELPAVLLLGVDGPAVVAIKGQCSIPDLKTKLTEGLELYKEQLGKKEEVKEEVKESQGSSQNPQSSASQTPPPASSQIEVVAKPLIKKKELAKPKTPSPPPEYHSAVLRIRLTNDEFIEHEFAAEATLREVFSYLDVHRTDGGGRYVLEMMYPRRSLGQNDYSKTLKELDLLPRSSMRLNPIQGNQATNLTVAGDSEGAGLIACLYNTIFSALGYLNPFAYFPSFTPATRTEVEEGHEQPPQTDSTSRQPQQSVSSTVRRRTNYGENVHGLYTPDGEESNKRDSFWNGNSTEFGGNLLGA